MNEEQQKAFEEAAKPLMKYLAENHNPHTLIVMSSTDCQVLGSVMCIETKGFLID